jgi:hypothetical protein
MDVYCIAELGTNEQGQALLFVFFLGSLDTPIGLELPHSGTFSMAWATVKI